MSKDSKVDWTLCLVADVSVIGSREILEVVDQAVAGGVTLVQLRAKTWPAREFVKQGRALSQRLKRREVPLIINDRVDVALACGAAGVHVGQEDIPPLDVRKIVGPERIIGVSVSNAEEARKAEKDGADYLGAGPVFATPSKVTGITPFGYQGLARITNSVGIPVLAIGGITARNAAGAFQTGIAGIAVISSILGRPDARTAAQALRRALLSVRKIKS